MNLKKLFSISDQFPYLTFPKKKVFSGFSLGLISFFIVLFVVSFNVSFKSPISNKFVFQGFNVSRNSNGNNNRTSLISWPFSFSRNPAINSTYLETTPKKSVVGNFTKDANNGNDKKDYNLKGTHLGKFSGDAKNGSFNGYQEKSLDFGDAHLSNFTNGVKNGSLNGNLEKNLDFGDAHLSNFTNDVKNGSFNGNLEKNLDFGDAHLSNVTDDVKNGSFNGIYEKNLDFEDAHVSNVTNDVKNGSFDGISGKNLDLKKDDNGVLMLKNYTSSYEECDIFNGRWVRDDTKPYYKAGSCPYIDRDFDCHLNKRPDDGYVKWKWQPFGCEIPSLNATDFLERLRGKKLVFVGDSLNRNMWESLVCILRESVKHKNRVYEISGRHKFKKKGFYAFRFEDYNCTVDFVSSPFLVQESMFHGKNGSFETLRLDLMDRTTSMYHDADVLVFNTGHWWTHEKTSQGEDYYQEGDHVYPRLKVLDAYRRALSTWARWVETNIDIHKTQVIFRGYSLTHFKGGQWNSGGKCHKETEPIFNTSHLTKYPVKMRAFDNVVRDMKTPIVYLNISRLTDYRKDGHPSIYRMEYKSVKEQIAAEQSQDCSHWCLPGVPDTWNELLYASLLKVGRGSWKL